MYSETVAELSQTLSRDTSGRRRCGLCLIELADLEETNLAIGDRGTRRVLQAFAERIETFARDVDRIVPIAPSKCAVLLGALQDHQHLALAMAKLERLFAVPLDVGGEPVRLEIRAGAAHEDTACDEPGTERVERLLRKAQQALIQSQRSGELVIADQRADDALPREWVNRNRLESALRTGELVPYFQPKVRSSDEALVGAELLIRWEREGEGTLLPEAFIPLAERTGLIRPLTWLVVKSGMAHCAQWPQRLGLALNVAPAALRDEELIRVTTDALALFGVDPGRLTFEVTETSFIYRPATVFSVLQRLRDLGIKIAIDDFGAGYSSFAYFRDIPADEVKIDRSFVANMARSSGDMAHSRIDEQVVKSIIGLGHNLSMEVSAEGVEDEPTAQRLRALGCDYLQGFLYGRPLPHRAFQLLHGLGSSASCEVPPRAAS